MQCVWFRLNVIWVALIVLEWLFSTMIIIICMTYKGFCITAAFVIITIRFNEDSFNWNYQLVTVMHSDKRCYGGRIKGELQILHNYSHLHSWPVSVWIAVTVRWTLLESMREVLFIYLLDRSCGFKWISECFFMHGTMYVIIQVLLLWRVTEVSSREMHVLGR